MLARRRAGAPEPPRVLTQAPLPDDDYDDLDDDDDEDEPTIPNPTFWRP